MTNGISRRTFIKMPTLVTAGGIYTSEAAEDDLGNERHPFSPLFHKGQELITKVREHTPE